eukprot:16301295-Heterocapsa_arctica.AAC.1
MEIIKDRRKTISAAAGDIADQITTMLSHLRRLLNVRKYADACNNMEVTAVRVLDRLLGIVIREESQQ